MLRFCLPLLLIYVTLFLMVQASYSQTHVFKNPFPKIEYSEVQAPVIFSKINFNDPCKKPPQVVEEKIHQVLRDFYNDCNCSDATSPCSYSELYFHTICVPFDKLQLFIVMVRFPVTNDLNTKLFLYDPTSNNVSRQTIDYDISALYNFECNKLASSNLRTLFKLYDSDINIYGFNNNPYLEVRSLYHNGTANGIATTVYQQHDIELDTVTTHSFWLR